MRPCKKVVPSQYALCQKQLCLHRWDLASTPPHFNIWLFNKTCMIYQGQPHVDFNLFVTNYEVTEPCAFAAYRSLVVQQLFLCSKLSFASHWKFFVSFLLCFAVVQTGSHLAQWFSETSTLHDSYRRYCSSNATANSGPPSCHSFDSVHSRNKLSHFAHAK